MLELLRHGAIEVEGRLLESSNHALRVELSLKGRTCRAIYKPVVAERPLWDFPDGTLAGREVAAHLVSAAGGWDVVPPTVLRDGPAGLGSLQQWIEAPNEHGEQGEQAERDVPEEPEERDEPAESGEPDELETGPLLAVVRPDAVPSGYLPVLEAQDGEGTPVVVVHADRPELAAVAVLDVALNNADRKGSHLLRDRDGHLWGFDHGVSLHELPKLRTILWGWAGDPLPAADIARLQRLRAALANPAGELVVALEELLEAPEVAALARRVEDLLALERFPLPSADGPAIPWPPW